MNSPVLAFESISVGSVMLSSPARTNILYFSIYFIASLEFFAPLTTSAMPLPERLLMPRFLSTDGFLRSASTSRTEYPFCASASERLTATVVLPSLAPVLETTKLL